MTKEITTLDQYAEFVESKILTSGDVRLIENVLGLVGESGEVAEKLKKMIRDKEEMKVEDMMKELGDCLFYLQAICNFIQVGLGSVIQMNVDKLNDRAKRGKLGGSGDNR
jgi:NTP pyrophosphatase (non-canonical NTP hydrolase)